MTITLPTFDSSTPTMTVQPVQQSAEIQPQPVTAQNTETTEQPKTMFKYDHLELLRGNQRAVVVHSAESKGQFSVLNFDDIQRVCQKMDDESAQRFRADVDKFKADGKLEFLLSPEETVADQNVRAKLEQEKREAEEATFRDLDNQGKELDEDKTQVEISALSNLGLTEIVTNRIMDALNLLELDPVYVEMFERSMKITVNIEIADFPDNRRLVHLVIDPQDMISNDVTEERANLERNEKTFLENVRNAKLKYYK